MKKDFYKKLKNYSLVAGGVAAATSANGQIIYTDVTPDATVSAVLNGPTLEYDIDLDNDGQDDIRLSAYYSTSSWSSYVYTSAEVNFNSIRSTGSASIVVSSSSSYVGVLDIDTRIDRSNNWGNQSELIDLSSGSYYGPWAPGTTDKYMGVRIITSTNDTLYGWVRLDIPNAHTFTVKSYAIQTTPNTPILAGRTTVLALENNLSSGDVSTYVNNGAVGVKLSDASLAAGGSVQVLTLQGQQIATSALSGAKTELPVNAANGIYLVKVTTAQGTLTKKVKL